MLTSFHVLAVLGYVKGKVLEDSADLVGRAAVRLDLYHQGSRGLRGELQVGLGSGPLVPVLLTGIHGYSHGFIEGGEVAAVVAVDEDRLIESARGDEDIFGKGVADDVEHSSPVHRPQVDCSLQGEIPFPAESSVFEFELEVAVGTSEILSVPAVAQLGTVIDTGIVLIEAGEILRIEIDVVHPTGRIETAEATGMTPQ